MTTHIDPNTQAGNKYRPIVYAPVSQPALAAVKGTAPEPSAEPGAFRIKSYYARTVEEALARAREEMGVDAVLVHSRKTPLESRHLGPYEVVFSCPGKPVRSAPDDDGARPSGAAYDAQPAGGSAAGDSVAAQLAQMRRQMEEIRRALAQHSVQAADPAEPVPVEAMARKRLIEIGLDDETASEVLSGAADALSRLTHGADGSAIAGATDVPDPALDGILRGELLRRLPLPLPQRERDSTADVVAFLGPPGAGKSASLIKLALLTVQAAARPIHLISADCFRVGSAEQMKAFASILGASIDFVDTPRSMAQAIEANRHKERILIDTPGLSGSDFELLDDLAAYLGEQTTISKYLVLPATMRPRDMKRCLARYAQFAPTALVFTHLDETDCFGPLYCASAGSGTPIAYFSAGQQIPEDLERATPARLLELLLSTGCDEAAA